MALNKSASSSSAASSSGSNSGRLSLRGDRLSCVVCYEAFNSKRRMPKILDCGHTFCAECLKQVLANQMRPGNSFPCPSCNASTPAADARGKKREFVTNYAILGILAVPRDPPEEAGRACEQCQEVSRNDASMRCCLTCRNLNKVHKHSKHPIYICGNCVMEFHEDHQLMHTKEPREKYKRQAPAVLKMQGEREGCIEFLQDFCETVMKKKKTELEGKSESEKEELERAVLDEDFDKVASHLNQEVREYRSLVIEAMNLLSPETGISRRRNLKDIVISLGREAERAQNWRERAMWWRHAVKMFRTEFTISEYMDAARAQWQLVHTLHEAHSDGNLQEPQKKKIAEELRIFAHQGLDLCERAMADDASAEHQMRMIRNRADYYAWISQTLTDPERGEHLAKATRCYEEALKFENVFAFTETKLVLMYNYALHLKYELKDTRQSAQIIKGALAKMEEHMHEQQYYRLTNREKDLVNRMKTCADSCDELKEDVNKQVDVIFGLADRMEAAEAGRLRNGDPAAMPEPLVDED